MAYGKHLGHGGATAWFVSAALMLSLGLCPQIARAEEAVAPDEEAIYAGAVDDSDVVAPDDATTGANDAADDQADPAPADLDESSPAKEADPAEEEAAPSDVEVAPTDGESPAPYEDDAQAEPAADEADPTSLEAASSTWGWSYEGSDLYYYDEDGSRHTGWLTLDEGTFYFDDYGALLRGLYFVDRSDGSGTDLYHFDEITGALTGGWVTEDSGRLHFDEKTGKADKGWKTISGKRYHFNSNYTADVGVVKIGSKRYAFGSNGALIQSAAGIRSIGGKKYFVKSDGSIYTGYKIIKGKRYVFAAANEGAMLKSCFFKKYIVAWNGVCYKIPTKKGSKEASVKRMVRLIAKCITPKSKIKSKKDLTRVREAADYIAAFADRAKYTMKGSEYYTPYGVFYAKRYSCAGTTRALGAVLTQLKIKWTHVNANKYTHQWCKVRMDGKWGWADSDIEYVDVDWDTGKVRGSTVTGDANYGKRF